MRVRKELIGIFVLLGLFIVAGFLIGGRPERASRLVGPELTPDPSVYNDRASGTKALYTWLDGMGYRPEVFDRNWDQLAASDGSVLIAVKPRSAADYGSVSLSGPDRSQLSADDAAILKKWLASGHTAIILSSYLPTTRVAGMPGTGTSFADALDIVVNSADSQPENRSFAPLAPVAEVRGVKFITVNPVGRVMPKDPHGVRLFGDTAGAIALVDTIGAGRLYVVADDGMASNAGLGSADNARFLANVLAIAAHPGAAVMLDEYHHKLGDFSSQATLWDALGRPTQLALIQLMLAAMVVVWALGVRFGAPTPLMRGVQRTSAEYVNSLATLHWRADARLTALDTTYKQFLRDLSSRLSLPSDSSLEQLAAAAGRRAHVDPDRLRTIFAEAEFAIDAGKIPESLLIDLVRRMDILRKDMGIV